MALAIARSETVVALSFTGLFFPDAVDFRADPDSGHLGEGAGERQPRSGAGPGCGLFGFPSA